MSKMKSAIVVAVALISECACAADFSVEERVAVRYGKAGLIFVEDPTLAAERYEVRTNAAGGGIRARAY